MSEEENERDFMKVCFNVVAGLEVKNESQAIAKEVILDEVENLTKENQQLKELKYKFFDASGDEESFTLEDYLDLSNKVYDLQEVIEKVKTEISSLMSKYFYEKDFCIEDIHLDKLLQILDKAKGE